MEQFDNGKWVHMQRKSFYWPTFLFVCILNYYRKLNMTLPNRYRWSHEEIFDSCVVYCKYRSLESIWRCKFMKWSCEKKMDDICTYVYHWFTFYFLNTIARHYIYRAITKKSVLYSSWPLYFVQVSAMTINSIRNQQVAQRYT